MRPPTNFGLSTFTILALLLDLCFACNSNSNRKKLEDVRKLTFKDDEWIRARDQPRYIFKQLGCEEGSAGCDFDLDEVTCYNRGVVDKQIKWICRSPKVTFPYRFGMTKVWCNRRFLRNNRPTTYIRDDLDCGLLYTVEYVGDIYVRGFLIGWVVMCGCYGLYKMYFKSMSPAPAPPASRRLTKDIVYDDDYMWGRADNRQRGPHTIGGTTKSGNPAKAEGRSGDVEGHKVIIPSPSPSKVEIVEVEESGSGSVTFNRGGYRSRTSVAVNSRSSVTRGN